MANCEEVSWGDAQGLVEAMPSCKARLFFFLRR